MSRHETCPSRSKPSKVAARGRFPRAALQGPRGSSEVEADQAEERTLAFPCKCSGIPLPLALSSHALICNLVHKCGSCT